MSSGGILDISASLFQVLVFSEFQLQGLTSNFVSICQI
jgi:hypothetical protein